MRGNSIFSTGEAALTKFIDICNKDEVNIYLPNEETFAAFKKTAAMIANKNLTSYESLPTYFIRMKNKVAREEA
ncbi:hypothetical protein [Ligilactobacillus agilis]|uniref:hypothetical protein n=1 Tax=Ligilactobacillus agilis TaxID=1601 RepID=UPI0018669A7A|nr:hypothetical protein [Ligilactobacillus agilis]